MFSQETLRDFDDKMESRIHNVEDFLHAAQGLPLPELNLTTLYKSYRLVERSRLKTVAAAAAVFVSLGGLAYWFNIYSNDGPANYGGPSITTDTIAPDNLPTLSQTEINIQNPDQTNGH